MNIFEIINNLLNKIEFSKKTKILISIIAISMITIIFLMFTSIFALKFNYETLYQKRTIPQINLQAIKDIYTVNIYDSLYDIKEANININDAAEIIQLAKQLLKTKWENYKKSINTNIGGIPELANNWISFFLIDKKITKKDYYQTGIINKIEEKMNKIDLLTSKTIKYIKNGKIFEGKQTIDEVFLEISSINIYLSSLIASNFKEAIMEKDRNDKLFTTSIIILTLLIGFTFFLSIIITFIIVNNFRKLNESLELKVNIKTKELKILNESLERKIKKEVENSRKKDQIMFQQARLASMGEMLQNIAHQWRQPLGAITMIIQSFQSKFLSGKLDEEFINKSVEDALLLAKSMSDTLEDFRTFFAPYKKCKKFNLKKAIEKSIDLTKYQLEKENINVYISLSENIEVYGFENKLIHVLLNLINNSKDALLENKVSDKKIWIVVKTTNYQVIINIIDNGGGIKNNIITKIFDPYFTTKHKSVGTGIGLYMSKQIIEKHMNGKILCKNIKHKMGKSQFYNCAMFTIKIPKKIILSEDNYEKK